MTTRTVSGLGWIKDLPDFRDRKYRAFAPVHTALPDSIDLRPEMPPVYDQGDLGSCTANAIAGAVEYQLMAQGQPPITPSRLFIYYNERVIENSVASDSGAQLRDGIKSVNQLGVCPESEWPYVESQFAIKPTDACYGDALQEVVLSYTSVNQTLLDIKDCLSRKIPFVFGISVYDSFMSDSTAATGIIPMPDPSESLQGGHAVMGVGYDPEYVIGRNSWNTSWGLQGYFKIPWAYILNQDLTSDLWAIESVK